MANYQNLKAAIDQVIKANGQKEITGPVLNDTLKAIVNSLGAGYQFMGVATPSTNPGTPDQNVFYIAGEAGTYTNFNSIVLPNGVSVLKWNGSWSSETVVAGDGVFDISAYKATGGTLATFADLSAALDGGNNIPSALRKGGMSVKFVQSSDNKYVQHRCIANEFTTDTTQWAIADEGVYVENPEFIYVKTDAEGKIMWAIKVDGDIYYGAGVPQQIIDYINEKIADLSLDEYEDIVAFLSDYLGSDTTLKTMIDSINAQIATKLDAEGLDPDALETVQAVENPEYIQVTTDSEDKVLEGTTSEGVKQINLPIDTPSATIKHVDNPEWVETTVEKDEKILSGIRKDGNYYFAGIKSPTIDVINSKIEELYNPSDILSLNPKAEILPILKNYKFHPSNGSPDGAPSTDYQNLSLLWFSDIHSDGEQLKRIMRFYNIYQDYFDDIICTGDVVQQTWADDFSYWHKNNGDKILFVNGNHDTYKSVGNDIKTYYSAQAGYSKYIEPFLASTQYTECPQGKMYWIKDYPESKIRIIAVDVMHFNERYDYHTDDTVRETGVYQDGGLVDNGEQLAWFVNKLEEARTNGYQVICTAHFPALRNDNNLIKCSFSIFLRRDRLIGQLQSEYQAAVQDFIDNGGDFICWMCGHHHQDELFISENYPKQLCVVVDCDQRNLVANKRATKENSFQSIVKPDGTKARDSFNIFNIEPEQKLLRLYRVGTKYDTQNRRIGSLVYDYKNKELIYN